MRPERSSGVTDAPLRVRHLLKGLGPGGAERLVVSQVTSSLSDGSPADGRAAGDGNHGNDGAVHYDVAYTLAHKDHLVAELRRHDITTHCLLATGTLRPGWIRRLRRLLREDPVDIVHVHSPVVAAATRLVVRTMSRHHRPLVVGTEHNRWPRHHRLTRWANRVTIGWQDVTIAVSEDVRSTMSARAARHTEVVLHGIDLDGVRATADRAGARAELGIADDDILVVCVANLRREKALEVLLEAAIQAQCDEPRLRHVVVGQGPCADRLADLVARSPVASRFALLGYRADATRIISAADIFSLSSRHEGLPVALMEALALGVPVAATAAGGIPEAIGMAGLTVAVDDHRALGAAQVELAEDSALRAELADVATAEAERFSVTRATATLEQIYRTASARAREA